MRSENVKKRVGVTIAVGLCAMSTSIYAEPVTVAKYDFEGDAVPCPDTADFSYTVATPIFINKGIDGVYAGATGKAALVRSDQTVNLRGDKMDFEDGTYLNLPLGIWLKESS